MSSLARRNGEDSHIFHRIETETRNILLLARSFYPRRKFDKIWQAEYLSHFESFTFLREWPGTCRGRASIQVLVERFSSQSNQGDRHENCRKSRITVDRNKKSKGSAVQSWASRREGP